MKKILLIITLLVGLFFTFGDLETNAACSYNNNQDISSFLDGCKPSSLVGDTTTGYGIETGLKAYILDKMANISTLLGIFAVAMLVYAGMLMQFSQGGDEKIKKAKDLIKWTLIGVIVLISSGGIVYIVINFVYGVAGN